MKLALARYSWSSTTPASVPFSKDVSQLGTLTLRLKFGKGNKLLKLDDTSTIDGPIWSPCVTCKIVASANGIILPVVLR
jgi:hypothetical protein